MFVQSEVKSFSEVITSPEVLEPVLAHLKLRTSPQALASKVGVTVPLDTVLIDLSVKDTSPTRARDIANEIARQSTVVMQALVTPPGQNVSPVRVTVTQWATTPLTPATPRKKLNLALGLLAGLVLRMRGRRSARKHGSKGRRTAPGGRDRQRAYPRRHR